MRYLRMLTNSLLAALLAAGYVLTLVLQLNPTLPLHPLRAGAHRHDCGAVLCHPPDRHLLPRSGDAAAVRARSVLAGWVSVGVLAWLGAAAAAAGAALMWANLQDVRAGARAGDGGGTSRTAALTLVMSAAFFVFVGVLARASGAARTAGLGDFVRDGRWWDRSLAPLAMRGRGDAGHCRGAVRRRRD